MGPLSGSKHGGRGTQAQVPGTACRRDGPQSLCAGVQMGGT